MQSVQSRPPKLFTASLGIHKKRPENCTSTTNSFREKGERKVWRHIRRKQSFFRNINIGICMYVQRKMFNIYPSCPSRYIFGYKPQTDTPISRVETTFQTCRKFWNTMYYILFRTWLQLIFFTFFSLQIISLNHSDKSYEERISTTNSLNSLTSEAFIFFNVTNTFTSYCSKT